VLIANGASDESIDAAKRYISLLLQPRYAAMPLEYLREEGYLRAIRLYLKLGLKNEAVGLSKEMIDDLKDNAIGRAQLGLTYIDIGDRNSAMEQYNILRSRIGQAQDKTTKTAYEVWASILWDKLHK
jgi:tetratricopeptide (TPR) repeat protein